MKSGLYRGWPYDQYASVDAVRASDLKLFDRTPAHAHYAMTHPEDTAAKIIGQATHVALLEPMLFEATYAVAPKLDRRTTAGKARWEAFTVENKDRLILTADEYNLCRSIAEGARSNPLVRSLLDAPGVTEASILWQHEGLDCKARMDRLCDWNGASTIIDLKTTRDASPRLFASDAARMGYDLAAAWYLYGADVLSPRPRRFILIALEKEPPYLAACYEFSADFLAAGEVKWKRALAALRNARESGEWPGYPTALQTLDAPRWALETADV